ncbi:transcription factor [Fusarium beomiforme]|uniref:Transcription factor n=1 Tax=Fusarium beomiforme TaxID=44412 RepID=A0A9P5DSA4_9HYPO|nr:transcription factor [Fusarium beomiforme]
MQLAADQASEHSKTMTVMTEQYISAKAPISKLWPIVGYGAYVCAAVQLRRCLALGLLTHPGIQETRINLRLTAELCEYWTHLRPVFGDMERQFVQATALAEPQEAGKEQGRDKTNQLVDNRGSHTSPALSSYIRTYIASNDESSGPVEGTTPQSRSSLAADQSNCTPPLPPVDALSAFTTIVRPTGEDSMSVDPTYADWEMKLDSTWWDQSPGTLEFC